MAENIALEVGEKKLTGWKSGRVESSLLTLSDYFELKGFALFGDIPPFKAGDECILSIENEPLITGYIDTVKVSTNGSLEVSGRDKTGDLIDCQTTNTSFLKQNVLSIVQGIAEDYGITATGKAGPTVDQFVVAQDETAADAIVRIVTNYGIIVTSDKNGNIVLIAPGDFETSRLSIKQGVNVRKAVGTFSDSARFSQIKAFGQNFLSPGFSSTQQGDASRTRIRRVFLADEVLQSDCQLAATRIRDYTNGAACSVDVEITTLDYIPSGFAVGFESEVLGIDSEMLIEKTILQFGENESSVNFRLVSPEKYGGDKTEAKFLK